MKYNSVLKFVGNLIVSVCGKVTAYVLSPIIYFYSDWIRNYTWNWMQVNGIRCKRSTIHNEDEEKYYTADGYILKRKTNKWLGYLVAIPYFYLDDDSDLKITSRMFHKPEEVDGLKIVGSYFDLGDRMRENKINIFKNWKTFKQFYYWSVIRNGFYNYNYVVEDSYMNQCGELTQGVSPRIHKSGPNPEEFSEHGFYQDKNGKWFFLMTRCKHFKGKAYGYEFGWRRKDTGGVNAVIRLYSGKPIEKAN